MDDTDAAAYVAAAANVDAIAAIALAAIAAVPSVDPAFDPTVVAGSGEAPPKAHKLCSRRRSPNHLGRRSPRRNIPFSSSS